MIFLSILYRFLFEIFLMWLCF